MPATPVLSNGGTNRGLPISCYLNSVSDSLEGIVGTWNENVWLASRGGGIGTYWGNVRGIGEPVGLNGKTSGIIPFVRVMDSLTLAISQGSLRRGSAACYLDVSHPEIEEFLEIRKPSGDFNRKALNLHHGVLLTDEFMEAVRDGGEFHLRSPKDGSIRSTVDARALFQKLVETRLATGEPYIVFSDTVNRMMPKHHRDLGLKVSTSNLCSEITLPTGATTLAMTAPRSAACPRSTSKPGKSGTGRGVHRRRAALPRQRAAGLYRPRAGRDGPRQVFGDARTLGRHGGDGLPLVPADEECRL
jgi:ribonucleoside-diphosphate reductase alpha chain